MAFIRNTDKFIEGSKLFFSNERAKAAVQSDLDQLASEDSAIKLRLDTIEGSGAGSIESAKLEAKAYADQKVAALVNSAPELLDTLKELADALNGDENFASTIAGQIGNVEAEIEQELLVREAADSALSLRLDVLEADPVTKTYVDSQISAEQLARNSAIAFEEAARIAADNAEAVARQAEDAKKVNKAGDTMTGELILQAGLRTLNPINGFNSAGEQTITIAPEDVAFHLRKDNFETFITPYYAYVAKFDPETSEYFKESTFIGNGQINLYDATLNPSMPVDPAHVTTKAYVDAGDALLSSRIDALESAPGPDVDKAYVDNQISAEQSARQSADNALSGRLDVLELDPVTKTYVDNTTDALDSKINLELFSSAGDGFSLTPAIIEAINNVEPSGPAGMGGTPVEISELVIVTTDGQPITLDQNGNNVNVSLADSYVVYSGDATQYQLVLVGGNMTDSNGLSAGSGNFNLGLAFNHPSSSLAQFLFLPSSISVPTFGGMFGGGSEAYLTPGYTFFAQSGSAPESLGAVLQQEISDRQAGDSALQGQIDTEKGRIDAILSAADADKDSFAEIVQLINSVDTSNDQAFASYVLSNDAALAQEVSDRQVGDSALSGRLDVLEQDPTTKTYVDGIQSALDARIDSLEFDSVTKAYVDGQISAEQSARQSAVDGLDSRLDVLESDPTTKSYVDSSKLAENIQTISASTSVSSSSTTQIFFCNVSGGSVTVTLPSATAVVPGRKFVVKDTGSSSPSGNSIVVAAQAGQTVDGQSSFEMKMPFEAAQFVSDGSKWFVM